MRDRAALVTLLLLATLASAQQAQRIAGLDPAASSLGDGGPATAATLSMPSSVAVDAIGNVYIADPGAYRIRRVTPGGIISTVAGNGTFSPAPAPDGTQAATAPVFPRNIALDSRGTLYFTDRDRLVRMIAPNGAIVTVAGAITGGTIFFPGAAATAVLIFPAGIAIDKSGNLYIAEASLHRVLAVGPTGTIGIVAGTGISGTAGEGGPASQAQFVNPASIGFDGGGNLFICDVSFVVGQSRVLRMSVPDFTLTRVAGGGNAHADEIPASSSALTASGIAVDATGNIYIAAPVDNTIRKVTTDGVIHTIAGSGQSGSGDGCGSALAAQFTDPAGVATDTAGNVYTAENSTARVRQITPAGTISTVAGRVPYSGDGGPATSAALLAPGGLALDSAGNLYIADSANNRIRQVTPAGTITTVAGEASADPAACASSPARLTRPLAVAVDGNGAIYVADTGAHRVVRFDPGGAFHLVAGTGTQGDSGDGGPAPSAMLNAPAGIAVDSSGNVYIADTGNGRVRVTGADGAIRTLASGFASPAGITLDTAGNLYVAESTGHRVTRLTPNGARNPVAGTGYDSSSAAPIPQPTDELVSPTGVAMDPSHSLYIADTARLQRISPNCALSVPRSGVASGVAADPQGNIYVSDRSSNTVWKLPPAIPAAMENATPFLAYIGFVNAASMLDQGANFNSPLLPLLQSYGAAPGELVRIRGVCLGPFDAVPAAYDFSGLLPTSLGGVSVTFDGTPAPLLAAQSGEILAIVPFAVAGKTSSNMAVQFHGGATKATVQVVLADPGIFTLDGSGNGPAAAVNEDGTINSAANPASRGSVLALWATGQGAASPGVADGAAASATPLSVPVLPVTVTVGGQTADILASALSPGYSGLLQVNIRIPAQIPAGPAAVVLSIGGITHNLPPTNGYSSYQTVTIAVK